MVTNGRSGPLHVLLLVAGMHPRDGGPPRVVYGSACALARQGVAVEIAATGEPDELGAIRAAWPLLDELGVVLHIHPRSGPHVLGYSRGLERFLRAGLQRFDAAHVHGVWELGFALATRRARAGGIATFVSPHGMLDRWQLQQSRLKKMLALRVFGTGAMLRGADAILYGTRDEADQAAPLGFPSPAIAVANGVDPLELPDPGKVRRELQARFPQMREWTRTVVFFSRLHPKKGLDLLVDAFEDIRGEFPDAGLLAVAIPQDAPYEAQVRAQIAALGSERLVLVTDMVGPAAQAVLATADIFCLPSHQEGLSIATLEAMSVGLPVLITTMCHMDELDPLGAGAVVPDTVDGLAAGLRRLLACDKAELAAMGARGAGIVEENYRWSRIARQLIDLYSARPAR